MEHLKQGVGNYPNKYDDTLCLSLDINMSTDCIYVSVYFQPF